MKRSNYLWRCLLVAAACCLMQAAWAVQPEPGFGVGGLARIAIGHGADPASAVAAQRDGRIVALATVSGQPALVRLQVDGSLDSRFGVAGKVVVDAVVPYADAQAMVVDSADRILIAGVGTQNNGRNFVVSRYLQDGSRDMSFGDGGTASIVAAGQIQGGRVLVRLDSLGRVVVAGACTSGLFQPNAPCLARMLPDGRPDADFNASSVALPGDAVFVLAVRALVIDATDRVLVGGGAFQGGPVIMLRRFLSDGRIDRNFEQVARAALDAAGLRLYVAAAEVDKSKRIVLAGVRVENATDTYGSPIALRLREDGALDTSFGEKGLNALSSLSVYSYFGQLQMQVVLANDGGLLITRYDFSSQSALQVLRLTSAGTVDSQFANHGLASANLTGLGATRALAVDGQARIIVAGDDGQHFAIARFMLNGQADSQFAGSGLVRPALSVGESFATAIARDGAGRTLLGGWNGSALTVVRLLTDGKLDPVFGNYGQAVLDTSNMPAAVLLADQQGRYIAIGSHPAHKTFQIFRLLENGSLDSSFNGGNVEAAFPVLPASPDYLDFPSSSVASALMDAKGRLLVAGTSLSSRSRNCPPNAACPAIVTPANRFTVARFLADGRPDPAFGSGGASMLDVGNDTAAVTGAVIDALGRIVEVGYAYNSPRGLIIVRWLDNGTPDPSWGAGGILRIPSEVIASTGRCPCVALDHKGRMVIAADGNFPLPQPLLARLNVDGSFDASFGKGGIFDSNQRGVIAAMLLDDEDRILLTGGRPRSTDYGSPYDWQVLRYTANGERDTSFNGRGEAVYAYAGLQGGAYAMALTAQGGLLLAGSMSDGKHGDMAVLSLIETDAMRQAASPVLRANGQTAPLQLAAGAPLTLSASLAPGSEVQQSALWWLWVESGGLTFWYNATRGWLQTPTPTPAYTGPLQSLPSFNLFQGALPPGDYHLHFAVDTDLSVAKPTSAANSLDLTVH